MPHLVNLSRLPSYAFQQSCCAVDEGHRQSQMMDIEKFCASQGSQKGFQSLSAFIANDNNQDAFIFKKFDSLAARNLLYLQSELAELQHRQDELDQDDMMSSDPATVRSARNWRELNIAAGVKQSKARKRLRLVKEIREKMREYQEALMLHNAVLSLPRPTPQAHTAFRNIYMNVGCDQNYPTLGGTSEQLYDDRKDLAILAGQREEDRLTWFLRTYCSILFLKHRPRDGSPLGYISARRISLVVAAVNVLLAAAFLFGALYNLYYVDQDQVKLGLIPGYTIAFALCIALITSARRAEIFGACAAYAAVLVVFVSGDLGGNVNKASSQSAGG